MTYYLWSWVLLFAAIAITIWAQARVSLTFNKFSKVPSEKGQAAALVARGILDQNDLQHVEVQQVEGHLTDHYDPRQEVLRLSEAVYNDTSVAAISIAAHEAGHAVQHAQNYAPLTVRSAMVPVVNVASYASWIFIIIGIIFGALGLAQIGIVIFGAIIAFQLVTLPVEIDASKRALSFLSNGDYLYDYEVAQSKKVLSAAALTYIAALLVSLLQMLRLIMIFGGRR
ncbi:MAG: zinc metallopeptidase [Bacillota bacterium]|jgi:Zn-dependent membrane protease YugP